MSTRIKDTTIIMTRGDTLRTKVSIFDSSGNPYIPSKEDKIRFALKNLVINPISFSWWDEW